jgi:hypothetical protein
LVLQQLVKEILAGLLLPVATEPVEVEEQAQLELRLLHQLLQVVVVALGSFLLLQEAQFNMLVAVVVAVTLLNR